MSARVLFIGAGDVGMKMADGLLARAPVRELILSDWQADAIAPRAAMMGNCHGVQVRLQQVDGRDKRMLEALIRENEPDLIVQCASLISPWSIIGYDHPVAQTIAKGGIALQIPVQLPLLMNVMEVVRELGLSTPVANITMPDVLHPLLATRGLAPTVGLGNVSIHHLRVRHRLIERDDFHGDEAIRVLGHHSQVYDVMRAHKPSDPSDSVRVYLGDDMQRHDDLAYEGRPFAAGPIYNDITAASALPVLQALLPDAEDLQFSAPAPMGLPGGYPLRIRKARVALDLPPDLTQKEAVSFNLRQGRRDGVDRVDADGTLHFTEAAKRAVAALDPGLTEAVNCKALAGRTERLLSHITAMS